MIYYSHPDMPLIEHLESVAENGVVLYREHPPFFPFFEGCSSDLAADIIYITLFSHDLGKGTTYFQDYLRSLGKTGNIKLKNHALISAFIGKYWVKKLIGRCNCLSDETAIMIPILSYLSILNHHGKMGDSKDDIEESDKIKLNNLEMQYKDMKPFMEIAISRLRNKYAWVELPDDFKNLKEEVFDDDSIDWYNSEWLFETQPPEISCPYYIFQIYLYSLLLDSDKTHTIYKREYAEMENECMPIPYDLVSKYLEKLPSVNNPMNKLRDEILLKVSETADSFSLEDRILVLQVPTGCGKTLTGLNAALRIAKRMDLPNGAYPRIVYCLPFTSVIDQNYEVYRQVFADFEKNPEFNLIKHHHLCDYSDKNSTNNGNEAENESQTFSGSFVKDRQFSAEGWNGQVIVSTLYQLFHSMFENRNRPLRKFHRFSNSIILIDEVQAISHKYFSLIRNFLKSLSKIFNCYFIFISATQPFIFPGEEVTSLCPDEEELYTGKLKSRVNLHSHLKSGVGTIRELARWAEENDSGVSRMFIMNTIKSSGELFNLLKAQNNNRKMFYLSTRLIPLERLRRINEIRQALQNGENILLVSTQMVEAGVDIDFREVIRDFAPWDSIMQSSGRCNRNSLSESGDVHIFAISDERRSKRYAEYIYDSVLLGITEELFETSTTIPESSFFTFSRNYYKGVMQKTSTQKGDLVLDAISALDFIKVKSGFRLIDEKFRTQDLFIPIDEQAKLLWTKYEQLQSNPDIKHFDKKSEFNTFKGDFLKYVISVPESEISWYSGSEKPIILLEEPYMHNYSNITGYSEADKTTEIFF
ncbi:MAG: CRISPR-associated helicase Cas3' [Firmicutes bacterium]|nr:CRISPR-associated helicase Cas3' [Bacillota bacterium]